MKATGPSSAKFEASKRVVSPVGPIAHHWFSIGEAASLLKRTELEVLSLVLVGPLDAAIIGGEFRISESSLKQMKARGLHVERR